MKGSMTTRVMSFKLYSLAVALSFNLDSTHIKTSLKDLFVDFEYLWSSMVESVKNL